MAARAPTSKAAKPAHSCGVTSAEFAAFCYLRLHKDVAASYGIESCNGMTTIGSMLMQMLKSAGADIDWHDELPDGSDALVGNEKGAAFISKFAKRPGRRLKSLRERLQELLAKDHVAPQATAAVGRKDGKKPKLSFPLIAELARKKRAKRSTCCYNSVEACADVAMVERRRLPVRDLWCGRRTCCPGRTPCPRASGRSGAHRPRGSRSGRSCRSAAP